MKITIDIFDNQEIDEYTTADILNEISEKIADGFTSGYDVGNVKLYWNVEKD